MQSLLASHTAHIQAYAVPTLFIYRATIAPNTPAKIAPTVPTSRATAPAVDVTVALEVPELPEAVVLVAVPVVDVVSPVASDAVVVAVLSLAVPATTPASDVHRLRSDAAIVVPHADAIEFSSELAEAESHEL